MKKWWLAATMALLICGYGAMWVSAEEAKPAGAETKAADATTTEAKSSEVKPAETKSADAKPAEAKSMEKAAAKAGGDAALQTKLEALERKVCDAFKTKDSKAAMEVIASDGWGADANGFMAASTIGTMMADYSLENYTMQDVKVLRLDKDAAILTYTYNCTAKYKGQPIPSGPYYVSTAYVNRGGKWQGIFHQETLAMSAMPNSTTAESTNK